MFAKLLENKITKEEFGRFLSSTTNRRPRVI